jgi:hypothetical protein
MIGFYIKYFKGDIFTNFIMMGIADTIAPLLLTILAAYFPLVITMRIIYSSITIASLVYLVNDMWLN